MKTLKKLFMLALSVLSVTMIALFIAACNVVAPPSTGEEDDQIRKVYATYVAYAEERGETPLSYE